MLSIEEEDKKDTFRQLTGLKKEWYLLVELESQNLVNMKPNCKFRDKWKQILFVTILHIKHYLVSMFGAFIFAKADSSYRLWIEIGMEILYEWSSPLIVWPESPLQKSILNKTIVGKVAIYSCQYSF